MKNKQKYSVMNLFIRKIWILRVSKLQIRKQFEIHVQFGKVLGKIYIPVIHLNCLLLYKDSLSKNTFSLFTTFSYRKKRAFPTKTKQGGESFYFQPFFFFNKTCWQFIALSLAIHESYCLNSRQKASDHQQTMPWTSTEEVQPWRLG